MDFHVKFKEIVKMFEIFVHQNGNTQNANDFGRKLEKNRFYLRKD